MFNCDTYSSVDISSFIRLRNSRVTSTLYPSFDLIVTNIIINFIEFYKKNFFNGSSTQPLNKPPLLDSTQYMTVKPLQVNGHISILVANSVSRPFCAS